LQLDGLGDKVSRSLRVSIGSGYSTPGQQSGRSGKAAQCRRRGEGVLGSPSGRFDVSRIQLRFDRAGQSQQGGRRNNGEQGMGRRERLPRFLGMS
jgi:hypothetical protein